MATSLDDALDAVPMIVPEAARDLIATRDALLVDVREPAELVATGKLRGALRVSTGMIGYLADPRSPDHDGAFRRDRPVILYCRAGIRSALAGQLLLQLGFAEVHNLGSFTEAAAGGLEVEPFEG